MVAAAPASHSLDMNSTTHIPEIRRLQRSRSDRKVAGVSGGLAQYFEIHPAVFRVGFIVLTLAGDRICAMTRFENSMLPRFGLPRSLPNRPPASA